MPADRLWIFLALVTSACLVAELLRELWRCGRDLDDDDDC